VVQARRDASGNLISTYRRSRGRSAPPGDRGRERDDDHELHQELLREDGHGSTDDDVSFSYDTAGNRSSMSDGLGTTSWSYDGLNRPTAISDPFNNVVQYGYDGVGMRTSLTNPFGYAGEWTDPTGLQYLQARYYSPFQGRFSTRDPFPGMLGLPGTQHPYAYALNNPVIYTDPSGEIIPVLVGVLIAASLGGALGGLGYYWLSGLLSDPCFEWDWGQAALWGGLGLGLGLALGMVVYGGWWVGVQVGLWGGISTGSYTVYWYIENGIPRYIGQTNNFAYRAQRHLINRGWYIQPIRGLQKLSEFDARAVEQVLIEHYGLDNLYNQINSILANNPIYSDAIQRGKEILYFIGFFR
jgi:RHS repeat-associated protein